MASREDDIIRSMNFLNESITKLYSAMTHADANQFGQLSGTNKYWSGNNPFAESGYFGDSSFLLKDLKDFTEKQKDILRKNAEKYSDEVKQLCDEFKAAKGKVEALKQALDEAKKNAGDVAKAESDLAKAEKELANTTKKRDASIEKNLGKVKEKAADQEVSRQWNELSENNKKSFGSFETFSNFQKTSAKVNEQKSNLSEYDNLIRSMGANGKLTRTGVSMLNQAGNLTQIASRLGGSGAASGAQGMASALGFGKVGGAMLGGLGKAAGGLAGVFGGLGKLLGGPWAAALQIGIEAVKMFGQVVGAANEYLMKQIDANVEVGKLEMEKQKAVKQKGYEISATQAQASADVEVESAKTANEIRQKAAETTAAIEIKMAEVAAQQRIMAAEMSASIMEKSTDVITSQFTEGINAAAWGALQSQIELTALAKEQGVEYKKLGSELGVETRKQQTQFNIASDKAQKTLETTTAKITGEAANELSVMNAELEQTKRSYDVDILKASAINKLTQTTDWKGRAANVVINDIGTSVADQVLSEDILNPVNPVTGEKYNIDKGLNKVSNDANAEKMRKIVDDASWLTGIGDSLGMNSTELRKHEMEALTSTMKFATEMATITKQGEAKLSNIEIGKTASIAQSNIDTSAAIKQTWADAQASMAQTNINAAAEVEKRWIAAGKNVETAWAGMARHMEEVTSEYDSMTNDLGIMMGYTTPGQLVSMQHNLIDSVKQMSRYGIELKEAMAMRQSYIENTNRNIQFTEGDNRAMGGLYKLLGHDSGIVAQYTGGMEIFNKGVNASVDLLNKAMKTTNKMGLNGRQFAKEIVNNLKLAQKYNFKEGTEGLMRMTQWAMKTRFNMQSIGSMIDSTLEGGLEGIIEQSSKLQVLGGNAAIYSDPFSMLFNAASSAEDYGQQILNMTKGLGSIDRKTGETTFNVNEEFMLRNLAKTLGMDVGELKDIRRSANRRDSVNLAMTAEQKSRFNKDDLDYIGNVAHYNKEKGGFFVNAWNEQTRQYDEVGVNELTPEQLQALQPVEHEERVEDYMAKILSGVETIAKAEIFTKTDIADKILDPYLENMKERAEAALQNYADMGSTYVAKALEMSLKATSAYKGILDAWEQNSQEASQETDRVATASRHLANALEMLWRRVENLNISNRMPTLPNARNMVNDAYVSGNGRSFFGAASHVTPINDGFIANPADEGLIGKRGGWVHTLVNNMYSMLSDMHRNGNMGLNVNGSLTLTSNGNSIDIINALRNDPVLVREITSMIFRQGRINSFGGRGDHPYNDGSRNTYI